MTSKQLPTKDDYQKALEELKTLNNELFYDDFKERILQLTSDIERMTFEGTSNLKEETETLLNRANFLLKNIEQLEQGIDDRLTTQQKNMSDTNLQFLESERAQLLFVYEQLQAQIVTFTEQNEGMHNKTDQLYGKFTNHAERMTTSIEATVDKLIETTNEQQDEHYTKLHEQLTQFIEEYEGIYAKIDQLYGDFSQQTNKTTSALEAIIGQFTKEITENQQLIANNLQNKLTHFKEETNELHKQTVKSQEKFVSDIHEQIGEIETKLEDFFVRTLEQNQQTATEQEIWQATVQATLKEQHDKIREQLAEIEEKTADKEEFASLKKQLSTRFTITLVISIIQTALIIWLIFSL